MPKGDKHWANTWTEIEDLGSGKLGATISVGHRVFFDKADGNKPKKHKLTDERPSKDYVLIQGAKCCVEVHPYYAKYFDVQHEEVRLYEERWVVQRLFRNPDKWRDVDAYNPVITVEEYSEPAGDVVKVTITYDTDYGSLTVEYFQRDGNALKHNVYFKNTSGSSETFRVLQRWAGIVGDRVNGKDFPLDTDEPFLAFRKANGKLTIAENLNSMIFNEDGSEKTDQCLQRPVSVEAHAQGMKADFVYGNWVLAQNEILEIDPDTATITPPSKDSRTRQGAPDSNSGSQIALLVRSATSSENQRSFLEFDISSISSGSTIDAGTELRLLVSFTSASGRTFEIRRITGNWTELGITWNDSPSITATNGVDVSAPTGNGWWNKAVVGLVQDALDAGSIAGFRLKDGTEDDATGFHATFSTKEGANVPVLYVEYTPAGPEWKQLQYTSEPPTPNAWNQLKHTIVGGWNQIKFEGE